MQFKEMRMHCLGDEHIIPLYRLEDSTENSKPSTTRAVGHNEPFTSNSESAAASKKEGSPEYIARVLREESERDYNFMRDLDDTSDWPDDDGYEEPSMNVEWGF
jgi:hypothetical protein